MSFTKTDGFKREFSFRVNTESLKFDSEEFQAFVAEATDIYNNDVFGFKKVLVSAPTLAMFAKAANDLASEGYSVLEQERAHSSSLGRFAVKFVKPSAVQNEDREWIKNQVQELYLAKVEDNFKAEKYRLIQDAVNEARRKDAEEIAKKERTRLEKIEKEAIAILEKQLQEAN
ncbi:hypothetical protein RSA46_17530 [Pseudomonas oryzihabitans]|uniref:hypothetical protein n=1 Tax=Pseudomonas rhizoryzae TaxID=2571129 RepID=UPI0007365CFF|nr:hypothetical protein [Pseudomonas rhizoryzae]KTT43226.1 hypothetical protein RSA46_17530 [Pseudomonas psychrotolerans]